MYSAYYPTSMMAPLLWLIPCIIAAAVGSTAIPHGILNSKGSPAPVIDLGYAQYQGSTDPATNITSYLGIRYGAPPTGEPDTLPIKLLNNDVAIHLMDKVLFGSKHLKHRRPWLGFKMQLLHLFSAIKRRMEPR